MVTDIKEQLQETNEAIEDLELINKLPNEVLFEIFTQLSIKDLCSAEKVCSKWNSIIQQV